MRGMNRVTLVGNLGNAPSVKELTGGLVVTKISLATTEVYRTKEGETRSETQWHTILFWGPMARLAGKYLKKGSLVLVDGKIRYRWYEEEGAGKKYVTEIVGDTLLMLDKPGATSRSKSGGEELDGQDDEPAF